MIKSTQILDALMTKLHARQQPAEYYSSFGVLHLRVGDTTYKTPTPQGNTEVAHDHLLQTLLDGEFLNGPASAFLKDLATQTKTELEAAAANAEIHDTNRIG